MSLQYAYNPLTGNLDLVQDPNTPLTTGAVSGMGTSHVAAMSSTFVGALTDAQIAALTATQIAAITTTQIRGLTTTQMAAFTATQLGAITTTAAAALQGVTASAGPLTTTQMAGLGTVEVAAMTTTAMTQMAAQLPLPAFTTTQLAAMTTTQIDALGIQASNVTLSTSGSVSDVTNIQKLIDHSWSTGCVDGGAITDNGTTVDIAACDFMVRETDDPTDSDAPLRPWRIDAATGLAIAADDVTFIYLDYNAGSPIWVATQDGTVVNGVNKTIAYMVGRNTAGTPHNHIIDLRQVNVDSNRKFRRQSVESDGFVYQGFWRSRHRPAPLTSSGLDILVGQGRYFYFGVTIDHSAFDTSGASVFTQFYNRTGAWTQVSGVGAINATQYDNAGTLTTMDNNKWRTDWVFVVPDSGDEHLVVITGDAQYSSQAEAQTAPLPTLPPQIAEMMILVGQITIQKGAASMTAISAGSIAFTGAVVADHGSLGGLLDNDHPQYQTTTAALDLTVTQMQSLTTTQANAMTTASLEGLASMAVKGMTTTNIASLTAGLATTTQIQVLTTTQMASLTPTAVAAMTTTAIAGLTNAQVQAIPGLNCSSTGGYYALGTSITAVESGQAITQHGDPTIETSGTSGQSFGASAYYFDGGGSPADCFEAAHDAALQLGSGDFTIDFVIKITGTFTAMPIGTRGAGTGGGNYGWNVYIVDGTTTWFSYSSTGSNQHNLVFTTSTLSSNNWYHLAFVRSGNTLTMYVNGVSQGTADMSGNPSVYASTYPLYVGANWTGAAPEAPSNALYLFNARVVKTAVWTSGFTPPAAVYTPSGNPASLGVLKGDSGYFGTAAWKGQGTVSANGFYDDEAPLATCYAIELANQGFIEDHHWSKPMAVLPGTEVVLDPETGAILVPASDPIIVPGKNPGLEKFKERLGTEFDPMKIDTFINHIKQKGHLSAFPNRLKLTEENRPSLGGWMGRVVEMLDVIAIHLMEMHRRVRQLEAGATDPYPTDGRRYEWTGKWEVVAFHPAPDPSWVLNKERGMYEPPPTDPPIVEEQV